jgi:hypothetical protein
VENFFSTVRQKVRYPNFFDFFVVEQKAFRELVKRYSVDGYFTPYIKKNQSKCYNNLTRGFFSRKDLGSHLPSRAAQKRCENTEFAQLLIDSQSSEDDYCPSRLLKDINCEIGTIDDLRQLGSQIRCSRHTHTIRESSYKIDPTAKRAGKGYVHCPFDDCLKTYIYQASFLNHCAKSHQSRELGEKYLHDQGCQLQTTAKKTMVISTEIATEENSTGSKPISPPSTGITSPNYQTQNTIVPDSAPKKTPKHDWTPMDDRLLLEFGKQFGIKKVNWDLRPEELLSRSNKDYSARLSDLRKKLGITRK